MSSQNQESSPEPRLRRSTIAAEKRKLRNRLSQQAFRARQNSDITDMKERLAQFSKSESDRNRILARENQALRQQLFRCEQKLRSLQATLKDIISDVAINRNTERGLDDNNSPPQSPRVDTGTGDSHSSAQGEVQVEHFSAFNASASTYDNELNNLITESDGATDVCEPQHDISSFTDVVMSASGNRSLRTLALIKATAASPSLGWPIDDGLETFMNIERSESMETAPAAPCVPLSTELPLYRSLQAMARSAYSEHIHAYEMCLVMSYSGDSQPPDVQSLHQVATALVDTFVKVAWQWMEPWMRNTNGEEQLARLTAWRICPNPDTLAALSPSLAPTPLQAAVPHPAVIDWCIFPFLRNKLIQYHSSDPALDEICGYIGMAYVVQADLSELVVDAKPLSVTLSVCDIIFGMESNQSLGGNTDTREDHQVDLPAPSLPALLHTREYAGAMYRHFGIKNGIERFYVDPELFKRYPHLREADTKIAQGLPLRSGNNFSWVVPRSCDEVTIRSYRQCVSRQVTRDIPRVAMEVW